MKQNTTLGKFALFTASFLWGISFIAVDQAMAYGWTPFALLGVRGLLAGLAIGFFALKQKFWLNKRLMIEGTLAGGLLFLGLALQTYGQSLSTVSNASFITVMYVVFIPIILIRKQKTSTTIVLAIIFAVIGTAFLTLQGRFSLRLGDALLIACAWVFAAHIIYIGQVMRYSEALSVATVQSLTMSVLGFSFAFFNGNGFPNAGLQFVAFAGLGSSGLAFALQLYGQKHVNPTVSGLMLTLEALFGTLGAILILREPVTLNIIVGGLFMMMAILTIELGPYVLKLNERSVRHV
jgi:drug/metabolite transporter (DMT)-like permease